MYGPRITLEQWRALVAVVESGGYAQAAEALHKTQSSVTYAVQKIEQLLDVRLFKLQGRKAQLTPAGQVLYRRAQTLLERAGALERGAASFADGWEPEVRIAVEITFPTWLLLQSLARFAAERPEIRVQLHETVLGGTDEALNEHRVDLAIAGHVPRGFAGDPLLPVRFIAAAHPAHPLHQLGRPATLDDLREHRQLVVRDTARERQRDSGGWLGAEQRWTVSHKATQIAAACRGLGFAWFSEHTIRRELDAGELEPLPMREGGERLEHLYLVFADPDQPGKAATRLAQILREDTRALASQQPPSERH
jgi:DNA-binding transcriptional LysR family regulator